MPFVISNDDDFDDFDGNFFAAFEDHDEPLSLGLSSSEALPEESSSTTNEIRSPNSKKKNVHFADDFGLQLVTVKYFECDIFPSSQQFSPMFHMLSALIRKNANDATEQQSDTMSDDCFKLLFPEPMSDYSKMVADKLSREGVALESIHSRLGDLRGLVRVRRNASSSVFVRLTFDKWANYHDWPCTSYPVITCDGVTDYNLFEFTIPIPPKLKPGQKIELCLCCRCPAEELWDNNNHENYGLLYQPKSIEAEIGKAKNNNFLCWSEFAAWNCSSTSSSPSSHRKLNPGSMIEVPYYW